MGKEVSLDELDTGIEQTESLKGLRDNLTNLQNRHGNHKQLFVTDPKGNETSIRQIKRVLNEIIEGVESGDYSMHAFEPRLSALPRQVEERARTLLEEQY